MAEAERIDEPFDTVTDFDKFLSPVIALQTRGKCCVHITTMQDPSGSICYSIYPLGHYSSSLNGGGSVGVLSAPVSLRNISSIISTSSRIELANMFLEGVYGHKRFWYQP